MNPEAAKKVDPAVSLERRRRKLIRSLKVEVCDLAACLRAMRRQELRLRGQDHDRLYTSRIHMKARARAALLAYGFVRGRSYKRVEAGITRTRPNWTLVMSYIDNHVQESPIVWVQKFAEWVDEGNMRAYMGPPEWVVARRAG